MRLKHIMHDRTPMGMQADENEKQFCFLCIMSICIPRQTVARGPEQQRGYGSLSRLLAPQCAYILYV
eukprot:COSAG01_NODE_3672_length_5809_cov_4.250263_4_plen_67_part_00